MQVGAKVRDKATESEGVIVELRHAILTGGLTTILILWEDGDGAETDDATPATYRLDYPADLAELDDIEIITRIKE